MAKRHTAVDGSWQSIVERLQEQVLASSGEDAFEEIFKLFVAKLYSEITDQESRFRCDVKGLSATELLNRLLGEANVNWPGIVPLPVETRLPESLLRLCIDCLATQRVNTADFEAIDSVFEFLVSQSSKGTKGQFFTPRHIIECCVRLVAPTREEVVVDPACGSGGFLVHALQYVKRESKPELDVSNYCLENLWGFDFDRRAVQVSKALMLVAGKGNASIYQLDSQQRDKIGTLLLDEQSETGGIPRMTIEDAMRSRKPGFSGFDVILTNPPFAGDIRDQSLLDKYQLGVHYKRIERDALFIERCISLLRANGRIAIVVPHNKLANSKWN